MALWPCTIPYCMLDHLKNILHTTHLPQEHSTTVSTYNLYGFPQSTEFSTPMGNSCVCNIFINLAYSSMFVNIPYALFFTTFLVHLQVMSHGVVTSISRSDRGLQAVNAVIISTHTMTGMLPGCHMIISR